MEAVQVLETDEVGITLIKKGSYYFEKHIKLEIAFQTVKPSYLKILAQAF